MWKRFFKLLAAPRPVPAEIVSALVDVNLLSLHLAEAKALLDNAESSPSLCALIKEFEESASRLLAELPEVNTDPEQWRSIHRRTRLLNVSFEGAKLRRRSPVAA